MIKYECDRCGHQTTNPSDIGKVRLSRTNYHGSLIEDDDDLIKDLCESCIKKLNEFLKKIPTKEILPGGY